MKKILRLVTTSVLTLTLVACGGNSSSSQSTTTSASTSTGSPSTSTSTSTTVAVTSISIASSSSLSQTLGSTSKVTVNATFNSGATQSSVDWYVNDVKQGQTGTTFEYTPTAVGSFSIVAKVGSVSSNALSLVVGAAEFEASEPVVVDADTIEITAAAGAAVVVANHDLKDTSRYSLSEGKYILELKKVLKQGEEVKITLSKDSKEVTKSFTYDIESLKVASVGTDTDGTYEITKPFYTDLDNSEEKSYAITWESDEITDTQPVSFSATAPEGATAMAGATGNRTITDGQTFIKNFVVNKDTVAGTYTFTHKVGSKEATATVVVKDPEASIAFNQLTVGAKKYDVTLGTFTDAQTPKDGYTAAAGEWNATSGVAKETDGSYKIVKPYLSKATEFKTFAFSLNVKNIDIPAALNTAANAAATPNRVQFTVSGPDGAVIRATNATQQTNLIVSMMRDSDAFVGYVANIDSTTTAGTYTIKADVYASSEIVLTKTITIVVAAPEAELDLRVDQSPDATAPIGQELEQDATDTSLYVISKPGAATYDSQGFIFSAILSNLESGTSTSSSQTTTFTSGALRKDLLTYKTSATGPQTIEGYDRNTLLGVELGAATANNYASYETGVAYAVDDIIYYPVDGLFYKVSAAVTAAANTAWTTVIKAAYTSYTDGNVIAAGSGLYIDGKSYVSASGLVATDTWDNAGIDAATNTLLAYNAATAYVATDKVIYTDGKAYVANGDVAANTAWAVGTAGATWKLLTDYNSTSAIAVGSRFWQDGVCYRVLVEIPVSTAFADVASGSIELNTSKVALSNGGVLISNNASTVALGKANYSYFASKDSEITLTNLFALEINSLTSTGDYVYTVQIGELTKTITIRVVEPVTKLDFKVAGFTGVTVDDDDLADMQDAGEYTVTCVSNAAGACGITSTIDLLIENYKASATEAYSLEVTTPKIDNKRSFYEETILTTDATGNDGHVESAALVTKTYNADGTGPTTIDITNAGDYVYNLTIAGKTKSFTIHALKNAALSVESVYDTGSHLFLDEAKGAYVVDTTFAAGLKYDVEIAVTGENLPSGKLYYFVSTAATNPTTGTATELSFVDGVANISATWSVTAANTQNPLYVYLFDGKTIETAAQVGTTYAAKISFYDINLA